MSGGRTILGVERGVATLGPAAQAGASSSPRTNIGGLRTINRGESIAILRGTVGAEPYSTTLCLVRNDNPEPGQDPEGSELDISLVAVLEFGGGQASERVEVDWLNGFLISPPTGNYQVSCRFEVSPGGPPNGGFTLPPTWVQQAVGVIEMHGTRPAAAGQFSQARLSRRLGVISPLQRFGPIQVPRRATAYTLLTNVPGDFGSYTVEVDTSGDPLLPRRLVNIDTPTGGEQVLQNGARQIWVQNLSANPARLSIVWSISL